MYRVLRRSLQTCVLLLSLALLAACPTIVPVPTTQLHDTSKAQAQYTWHNIAPLQRERLQASRFADLNFDGHVDILTSAINGAAGFNVAWGDGKGHWALQEGPTGSMHTKWFSLADVDGDVQPEILIGGTGKQQGLQVWKYEAVGGWRLYSSPTSDGNFSRYALDDIDGDMFPDVVAAEIDSEGLNKLAIWLNDGRGGWRKVAAPGGTALMTGLVVADVNADGHKDILVSQRGGMGAVRQMGGRYKQVGGVRIWLGNSAGAWEPEALAVDGDAESVAVGDVNQDGRVDILAGLYQNGIRIWLAQKAGWNMEVVTPSGTWGALKVHDAGGVGQLVAASRDGSGMGVWRWTGGGLLASSGLQSVRGLLPDQGVYAAVDMYDVFQSDRPDVLAVREEGGLELWSERDVKPGMPSEVMKDQQMGDVAAVTDLFHVDHNQAFKTEKGIPYYRIGAGDVLSIVIWDADKPETYKVEVKPDGSISVPYLEAFLMRGKTLAESDALMTSELGRYFRWPRVDVQLLEAKSKSVKVFDEEKQSNGETYYLQGKESVVEFISRIKSLVKPDLSRIRLIRHGEVTVLNVKRAIVEADNSENAILDGGDILYIPSLESMKKQVYVLGEVKKQGVVTLDADGRFLDAVGKSGGFTADAYYSDIRIVRSDRNEPKIYAVAFNRLLQQGDLTQDPMLHDRDIIIVPAEPIANWNRFLKKLVPTLSTTLQGTSTIQQVISVRDLLNGTAGANANILIGGG